MTIPTYQQAMVPALRALAQSGPSPRRAVVEQVSSEFNLTPEEREQLLPSGIPVMTSRVGWALAYMKQAGVVETPKRGTYQITERGKQILQDHPNGITAASLEVFPEFVEFQSRSHSSDFADSPASPTPAALPQLVNDQTPEEALESASAQLRANVLKELLEAVKAGSPAFFENLVIDLLVRMGYGGSRPEAARAVGRSGDGGIDGIIDEDRLGLDVIHVQAKRWEGTVGRPEIQKFVGALQGQRARKGIFITTSSFSRDAVDYTSHIESRVVLIDGTRLSELMFDFGLGVNVRSTYTVRHLDSDYFSEE